MEAREQKGLEIAAKSKLQRSGDRWFVPSQTAKLIEICLMDMCDTVIIVSGDTDIVPAVRAVHQLFPKKEIGFLLPYKRHNNELKVISKLSFLIARSTYQKFQFPDPYVTATGKKIRKPPTW